MFSSVISSSGLTINSLLLIIISSIILDLIISIVHMLTSKYSKNYIITLAILPILVSTIIIMVNGNLGTGIAIAGAFSLVRFRSLPGNSKEIASVFWAMATGIAIGMGQILFASLVVITVSILLIILNKTKFGEDKHQYKVLEIVIPETLDYQEVFNDIFNKYIDKYELIRIKTTNLGSLYELKYDVILKNNINEKELIDELRVKNGNLKISMHNNHIEEVL